MNTEQAHIGGCVPVFCVLLNIYIKIIIKLKNFLLHSEIELTT